MIVYFLEVQIDKADEIVLTQHQLKEIGDVFTSLPNLSGLCLYTPDGGIQDPYLGEELSPPLIVKALFNDPYALENALLSSEFGKSISLIRQIFPDDTVFWQEAMFLEILKDMPATPGNGSVSFVVNYQRPAENENEFIRYYSNNHPPIMKLFPGLRGLELGTPIDWSPVADIQWADRMLYNEVNFDNIEDLTNALNSETRMDLRKDFGKFPPFTGLATHYPMRRIVIV